MVDAVEQGADCIITVGDIQSNHCRATAVAARYLNLDCFLILRTSKVPPPNRLLVIVEVIGNTSQCCITIDYIVK